MKKKVTSTDIAHAAGVSQSTVSMILNKKYDVSFAKDTVERVENAAKNWDMSRRSGKREKEQNGRSFLLYSAQPDESVLCYAASGIEAHAKEKRFRPFVCNTQRDLRMEERYLKMMWQLRPLGIIYTCNPSHLLYGTCGRNCRTDTGCGSSITRMKR